VTKVHLILVFCLLAVGSVYAADIRLGVEVEFRTFYLNHHQPDFSFQFQEAKLFLDTFVSEDVSALLEYDLKNVEQNSRLKRGYLLWSHLPLNAQIKLGQFRIPFGFWDVYTIEKSLNKNSFIGSDESFAPFLLRDLDIGVQLESYFRHLHLAVAVVNGNTINNFQDNNNQKDVAARVGFTSLKFSLNLDTYVGVRSRGQQDVTMNVPSTKHIFAVGADWILHGEKLTLSGEVISVHYQAVRTFGSYMQFHYDLLEVLYGLRFIGKVEFWNPNTRVSENETWQTVLGFKQTISRGLAVQLEYRYNTRQTREHSNGVMFEMEIEL